MGEIFSFKRPDVSLPFSGERFTNIPGGPIEVEHLHRYLEAREVCRGKDILDVASGEGYGSALLAQVAQSVIGVELSPDAVSHASQAYDNVGLRFIVGDARQLPIADASIDVAVSFETIEHFAEHAEFLGEIRRVLRPDGLLILSTPDRDLYSPIGEPANPFHVQELTRDELRSLLGQHFAHVALLRQRVLVGSALVPEEGVGPFRTFETRGPSSLESSQGLTRAKYLVAFASNVELNGLACSTSVYVSENEIPQPGAETGRKSSPALADQQVLLDEARANEQRWRNDLTTLSTDLGSTRQRLLEKEATVVALQDRIVLLAEEASGAAAEVTAARQAANEYAAAAAELRADARRLQDDAVVTASDLAASRREIQTLHDALATARTSSEADLARLVIVQDEARRVESAAGAAEARLQGLALLLKAAEDRETDLLAREAGLQIELTQMRVERDRINQQAAEMQREVGQTRRELVEGEVSARRELEDLRNSITARDAELTAARAEMASIRKALDIGHLHNAFLNRFLRWDQSYVLPPSFGAKRLIRQARRAAQRKLWRAAELRYRTVLNSFPRLQGVWVQYGHAMKEQGDHAAAFGAYGKALQLGRRTADTLLHLGHAQHKLGLRSGAEHNLLQALQLRPSMPNLWTDLRSFGWTEVALIDNMLSSHNQTVTTRPGHGLWFSMHFSRARKMAMRRSWRQAVIHYGKALAAAPDDARTWLLYGHAVKETGDRQGALQAYLQALVLDPLNQEPRLHLVPLRPVQEPVSQALAPPTVALEMPDQVIVELSPGQDLQSLPDGSFITTGGDPQFALNPTRGNQFPHGLVTVSIKVRVADPILRPILYVWSGNAVQGLKLPIVSGAGTLETTLQLPQSVTALRLDPTTEPGVQLHIEKMSFRQRPPLAPGEVLPELQLSAMEYDAWVRLYDTLTSRDEESIRRRMSELRTLPLLSVVMPVYNPRPRYFRRALETVLGQLYTNWELCIADDASTDPEIRSILKAHAAADKRIKVVYRKQNGHISAASNSALELVSGEFVVLMDHDDELPSHALYMIAEEINRYPDVDVIYTDEDKVDGEGRRHDPHFKTGWNPDLFYAQNIIAHLGVYRTTLVRAVGGFRLGLEGSQDYDFSLRILGLTNNDRIRHIPFVLYHWRIFPGVRTFSSNNPDKSISTARRALVEHFQEAQQDVDVLPLTTFPGWWRVRRKLPEHVPSVTLIIPTRDRVELLRGCVEGLLNGTDYPKLAIIVVDNGSVEPETLSYFAQLRGDARVRILRVEGPFNYSALNNVAVRQVQDDLICFMNNDIEVTRSNWLTEMVSQAVRPGIGAVGTKLLYANGNIQHAGVTLGVYGVAAHGHRHYPTDAIGYFGRPQLQQDLSAVTAAALIMPRHLFNEIGGFDAANLAVGYNDVDLCLRIREAGYRVIYTPFAELRHLESASRGMNLSPKQIERDRQERSYMVERWGMLLRHDPFYSDNLSLQSEDFELAFPPRISKPWLDGADAPLWQHEQRRLDRIPGSDAKRLDAISSNICVVVASAAPLIMFTRIVASLVEANLVPGHIIVVDNTDRGTTLANLPGAGRLRERRPCIELKLVRDGRQDSSISRAVNMAVRAAGDINYLLIFTEDAEPAPDWFEYMVKAYAGLSGEGVLSARVRLPNGTIEEGVSLQNGNSEQVVVLAENYDALPEPKSITSEELTTGPILHQDGMIVSGVFLGRREVLCPAGTDLFDERLYVVGREEELSERLRPAGVSFVSSAASLMSLLRDRPRDLPHLWKHVHDYAWLNRKLAGRQDNGTIEFVCPFHRGDVLIGLQVAAQAARLGLSIRMHVAAGLIGWVKDFAPDFPIKPVPVPVPPAAQTILNLLRASLHVVQQPNTSPRIALSHPMRGLDATDNNLVAVMLEAVGLPGSTRLVALRPQPREEQAQEARRRLAPYGKNVILVHRSGGWGLKTIPDAVLRQIVSFMKQRNFSVVQIGGPGDEKVSYLDGAITEGLSPLQWAAIFHQSRALIGVDSWSAHFASILDIPQITLYGSTAPQHVNSKAFFIDQNSPSLLLGPVVDCSPCNSLTCLRAPVDFCLGYTFDPEAVGAFLDSLPMKEDQIISYETSSPV